MFDNDNLLTLTDIFSHEFRTPLAIIRSYTSNIERRYAEGNIDAMDVRMATTAIRCCCNSLSRLSSNMSIAAKDTPMYADRFYYDIAEQINSLCFIANELFAEQNVKITFTPKTTPCIFSADPDLMVGIILNLISNGLKYNNSAEKHVDITLEIKKDVLHITVKDNGIGFPMEDAEKIFDMYYRSDNSSVMMASGLGLGLYIVNKEVKAHDGTIVAKSTKKGTTFKIEIPKTDKLSLRSPQNVYVTKDIVEFALSGELMKYV